MALTGKDILSRRRIEPGATVAGAPADGAPAARKTKRGAFTLVELMVVLALVLLILGITLPSVTGIFRSGARAMTFNLMDSQLEAARMIAQETGTAAGVHAQLADTIEHPKLEGVQYITVVIYNDRAPAVSDTQPADDEGDGEDGEDGEEGDGEEGDGEEGDGEEPDAPPEDEEDYGERYQKFTQAPGLVPHALPRLMAVGDADNPDVRDGVDWLQITDDQLWGDDNDPGEFTTFSIIFSGAGIPVTKVNARDIHFYASEDYDGLFSGLTRLWVLPQPKPATRALTIFDFAEASPLTPAKRQDYLNESAQYIPVNHYTGRLYLREQR